MHVDSSIVSDEIAFLREASQYALDSSPPTLFEQPEFKGKNESLGAAAEDKDIRDEEDGDNNRSEFRAPHADDVIREPTHSGLFI